MLDAKVDADSRSTAQRLQDALAALVRTPSTGVAVQPLTATTLCQIAGISRNALYRYHPEVLAALHEAQRSARDPSGAPARQAKLLRRENRELREQLGKLAALVDHYFAAWQDAQHISTASARTGRAAPRHRPAGGFASPLITPASEPQPPNRSIH